MYVVLKRFTDLQDGGHLYRAGDHYPRPGYQPDLARLAELEGNQNRQKVPLIKAVQDKKAVREREKKKPEQAKHPI